MTQTTSLTAAEILVVLCDRFKRQARKLNINDDSDGHLASLAKVILAEACGISGVPSSLYGPALGREEYEAVGTQAMALNAILMESDHSITTGHNESAPGTLAAVWGAMASSWLHTTDQAQTRLAEALVAPTNTFSADERKKVDAALVESFRGLTSTADLLNLLALPTKGANDVMVRRGFHTLTEKVSVERLVFAAACLNAVSPPGPYTSRASNRYWLTKEAAVAAIKHIDELAAAVEGLNFSAVHSRASEPPHRRLKMSSPRQFEYSWYTSSDPSVFGKNRQYYHQWLDDAAGFVRCSIKLATRRGFTIRLSVHFVEHKPLWGAGAAKDEFPPIIDTLERVID